MRVISIVRHYLTAKLANGYDPHYFDIAVVTGNILKNIVGNIADKIVNYGLKDEFDNVLK